MKFSIITCSYNCLEGLKAAREQVLAQKEVEIEHIIIDGGSKDGTREWLEEMKNLDGRMSNHQSLVTPLSSLLWLSEPDRGLYDALNKGLHLATGDIIGVLHTDDVWEHDHVLAHVAEGFRRKASLECGSAGRNDQSCRLESAEAKLREGDPHISKIQHRTSNFEPPTSKVEGHSIDTRHSSFVTPDALYGDLYYVASEDITKIRRVWRSGSYHPRKWFNGWMPPHTALFVRREAALRVGDYRLDHGSAADYEWMLRAGLVHHLNFAHLPEVLLRMRVGGASNQSVPRRLEAHNFDRHAWERNGLKPYPWTLKLKPLRKLPQWLYALRAK